MKEYLWALSLFFFAIITAPYLITGFYFTPGIISIPDLIDLLLYPVIIGYILFLIYKELFRDYQGYLDPLYFLLIIIHFVGHGFHWAANAINETIKHFDGASTYAANYAYYLDEIISHKIMFYSIIGIFYIILYMAIRYGVGKGEKALKIMTIPALVFSFSFSAAMVEGQCPYELLITTIIFLLITIWYARRDLSKLNNNYVIAFFFIASVFSLALASTYYIIFRGFPQPSEILH